MHGPNRWNRHHQSNKEPNDDWLMSYADMITLILGFFILLVSISKIDPVVMEKVAAGVAKDIGRRDVLMPIESLRIDVQDVVREMGLQGNVGVGTDDMGVTIVFSAQNYYKPGTAEIRDEGLPSMKRIAETITNPKYKGFQVEVQGHTDDIPLQSQQYPSNWELSASRATTAVRLLIGNGVPKEHIKAVGFADTAPRVPNRDMNGNPLVANQAINRRVVIRVYPRPTL
ncbi:MAG: OmpA family protein [Rhodospirillales bacterium]|nr:OmpA family protein [Rhodospirillales bacterium]